MNTEERKVRKLKLHRETLRGLSENDLEIVVGGPRERTVVVDTDCRCI